MLNARDFHTRRSDELKFTICVCVWGGILGQILQMASCPQVALAAGMEKRTGKMDPPLHLLRPTQSIPVGQPGVHLL